MENKQQFVSDFQEALIKNGDGRYDWLMDSPIYYERYEHMYMEVLKGGGRTYQYNVTGDSLTAIAREILHMIG